MQGFLPEMLESYLAPLVVAVPLALLVLLITLRRGSDLPPDTTPTFAPPPAPPAPPAAGVLVVDDSAVARAKLRRLFESAGYSVHVASDGQEALEVLAHHRYAVLVTDLEMPHMDGFALIAAVQGDMATEDLPIIAITGHDELQTRVNDIRGLYGIFKKPWNDRELLKRVAALASLPQATAG